ncbi:hypothetical protein VTK26DRAFT_4368 [Humicola hyalothermophila]
MFEELAQQREKVALFYSDGNTRGKAPGTNTNTTPAKTANRNTWIAATTPTRPEALRRAETPRSEVGSVFGGNSPVLSPRSSVFPTPTPGKQRIFRGIPRSFEEVDDSESDNVATAEGAARSAPRGGQPQPGPSQPFSTPKRKRVADDDEDEYGGDDLDGDELIAVADTVASRTATPSSSQLHHRPGLPRQPIRRSFFLLRAQAEARQDHHLPRSRHPNLRLDTQRAHQLYQQQQQQYPQ